ncbi:uncharacterized protein LOC125855914 [Solanum stenotomum]|uniref:uncharacterized protein LOC125855914 n=1 Tax=Solanum stenotomum TaxID=172797 RepID=UPI0020D1CDCE|nr:uncharacterized protein LOC125855914 [Solanum stenotomum]
MIMKIGHLADSADVRATRLERDVQFMIEAGILASLTPLQTSIDTFTMRVEACDSGKGETSKVTAFETKVADLRKDVDYLKSTDFTSLLEAADDLVSPETSEIPLTTTGDVQRDEAAVDESDAKTDEDKIERQEESIYEDL